MTGAGADATAQPVKAVAQTRAVVGPAAPAGEAERRGLQACAGLGRRYEISPQVEAAAFTQPYVRRPGDPVYRPLRIFTLDPAETRITGRVSTVNVPFEPLERGPRGALFEVDPHDGVLGVAYRRLDSEDRRVLIQNGVAPTPSDPASHQQMVYAVCSVVYASFRAALGRVVSWGFDREPDGDGPLRLRLRPFAHGERNAFYDASAGELQFGYFPSKALPGRENALPGEYVFTALSHDIVAHEVTHALLDGLRTHFDSPTSKDTLAFHEGFADLVAILQHFSYKEVVAQALRETRGRLRSSRLLWDLATQFGHSVNQDRSALRTGLEQGDVPTPYDAGMVPHRLGSVLVSSVFDAFARIFDRKVERYVRAATNGRGLLPEGELQADLLEILAKEASRLASQFLAMCIRAIDYCPPVDMQLGEFLRAVITADSDLVPDDPWGYREEWINAFGRRRIYPRSVPNLSQDALRWRNPLGAIAPVEGLTFSALRFRGDPGQPAGPDELRRQACVLGEFVTRPENLESFGLLASGDPALKGDAVSLPLVHSVRTSRRVGPDGQVIFDVVAEVLQTRIVHSTRLGKDMEFCGGSTVILGPDGEARYLVIKSVASEKRLADQEEFIAGEGQRHWTLDGECYVPRANAFRMVHQEREPGYEGGSR